MNKISLIFLIALLLASVIIVPASAGKGKDFIDMVVAKIERKYEEFRASAPFIKAKGKKVAQSIRFIQPEDQVIEDFSKLRQIALVRHGEPDINKNGRFTRAQAQEYIRCYDSVCIIVPEKPFFNIRDQEDVKVFSSPLNRALTTAQYLCGTEKEISVSPLFREFETSINSNSNKKLPIKVWTGYSRVKWMLGGGKKAGIESFKEAKQRAKEAAKTLNSASADNPKVLLTAHGLLNRYIKKELKKQGWKVVEDTGSDYFGTTILVKVN